MAIGIDELFEMLDCNNNEEIQRKAVEEGVKVKNWLIFVRPVENKNVWENCAKIIIQNPDETTTLYSMFDWLQNSKWPGYDIIYNRIKIMLPEMLIDDYRKVLEEAQKLEDETWLTYLSSLTNEEGCKGLYDLLTVEEKKVVDEYSEAGLYRDEIVYDIKYEYLTYLERGMTNEEATKKVIEENERKGALLWLALADTQWKYGRLLDKVKEKAIECIDSGIELEKWKENEKLYRKRGKVLENLKERFNSEQPQKRKIPPVL